MIDSEIETLESVVGSISSYCRGFKKKVNELIILAK